MTARSEQEARVLDVAIDLFAEHGFDEVTMADIANEGGVARATVFNYFGSKHGLIEAVTETVIAFYQEMLDDALSDATTSTPDLLRRLYEEMGKGIEAHRRLFRSVFREIARIGLGLDEGSVAQRANAEAISRLESLIARGQTKGELDATYDPKTLATAFRSLANGTITNWLYEDASEHLVARMRDAAGIFLSPIELPRPSARRARPKEGR